MLVTGGENSRITLFGVNIVIVLSTSELFDPANGTFAATGSMTNLRTGQSAILLKDGNVLGAGGNNVIALDTAELFDPLSGSFLPTGSMETARTSHEATLLNSGKVLVTGGQAGGGAILASAELYQ